MWVINIQHWLDETMTGPGVPQLNQKVKKLAEIITYATSITAELPVGSIPKCWRRPKRKPCQGELDILVDRSTGQIQWLCPICNDEGIITGWEGLIWDMLDVSNIFH
jgi:hypothetical protein